MLTFRTSSNPRSSVFTPAMSVIIKLLSNQPFPHTKQW